MTWAIYHQQQEVVHIVSLNNKWMKIRASHTESTWAWGRLLTPHIMRRFESCWDFEHQYVNDTYCDFHCYFNNLSNTHTHARARMQTRTHTHSRTPHHLLRDIRLFFLIKEIVLLCWLFYLMPWLPLCAPHQAVTDTRRRATGLIGAWDAQGGAARMGGRRGKPLMGSPVFGSSLSPLSGSDATHLLVCFLFLWLSNHLHRTTAWFVR